ncbi:MAG TPA: class I SAM-dependent methyltransferase [Polyangiaceae bacterium]|jgi:SAM-dependent methyltransferase
MTSPLARLAEITGIQRLSRGAADWVDLQYSLIMAQLSALAPRTHGRLLDVGCGEKPYEAIFRPYVKEYVGVEYEASFGGTQTSVRSSKPDYFYDGKRLPFEAQSFDVVLSIQVLEHTPSPQVVLNEMARVVKKGGLVVVNAPFSFRLHEEPHDYFRYTPHAWRAMFDEAGLEVDEIWNQGDLWTVLGHKLNSYLAFRVARLDALAQQMGKLGHEGARTASPRFWTFPLVLPAMFAVSGAARVLDRVAPDGTESLSYLVIGRPKP